MALPTVMTVRPSNTDSFLRACQTVSCHCQMYTACRSNERMGSVPFGLLPMLAMGELGQTCSLRGMFGMR